MGRTIDADKLVDVVKKWYWNDEQQNLHPDADLFIHYFITTIKEQPTVQPEPRWISVKDRLPQPPKEDEHD